VVVANCSPPNVRVGNVGARRVLKISCEAWSIMSTRRVMVAAWDERRGEKSESADSPTDKRRESMCRDFVEPSPPPSRVWHAHSGGNGFRAVSSNLAPRIGEFDTAGSFSGVRT
jgi:hypothetical protein